MKKLLLLLLVFGFYHPLSAQIKTIHVYVALCDNQYQGIVPVPAQLGNGQDPKTNLYWGAAYGVKSFLINKADQWTLIDTFESDNPHILERLLFKHKNDEVYLLADAYDGKQIKDCIIDFLKAGNHQKVMNISYKSLSMNFGGGADLVAYVGHNGLMDFDVDLHYTATSQKSPDAIILGCYSKQYFAPELEKSKAKPLLWTTHLMAPEAYTLAAAIDGWILGESGAEIEERAAQSYNAYQKCGIKGARNLFDTGL